MDDISRAIHVLWKSRKEGCLEVIYSQGKSGIVAIPAKENTNLPLKFCLGKGGSKDYQIIHFKT